MLGRASSRCRHKARRTIYYPGDPNTHLLTLVSGVVAGVVTMSDGRKQFLSLHFPGDIIGRTTDKPLPYELIAMTDVTICYQPRKTFLKVLESDTGFHAQILDRAQEAIDQSRSWMLALGRKTARERVATFLYFVASRSMSEATTKSTPFTMTLPLTREEIGDFLGVTVETVSRQFSALRKDGIIKSKGREITFLNIRTLLAETGDDDGSILI
jgi:CRP/FNR family transcriptional regulator